MAVNDDKFGLERITGRIKRTFSKRRSLRVLLYPNDRRDKMEAAFYPVSAEATASPSCKSFIGEKEKKKKKK